MFWDSVQNSKVKNETQKNKMDFKEFNKKAWSHLIEKGGVKEK